MLNKDRETLLNEANKEFELNDYKVVDLLQLFDHFKQGRRPHEKTWKLLDAYDRGLFWETLKTKIAPHQILPETNYVNYVKTNIVNSVYAGVYRADVFPRNFEHVELARKVNQFLEYTWDKLDVKAQQVKIGDRAALLNVGACQFGWDDDIIDSTGANQRYAGDVELKFIDTMALYLDPATRDFQKGRAVIIADEVSITELEAEPKYKKRAKEYIKLKTEDNKLDFQSQPFANDDYGKNYMGQRSTQNNDQTVRLLTVYYKVSTDEGYRIDQIELIDDGFILRLKKDIRPKRFPIVLLYSTPPIIDSYGTPVPKLVLSNIMTINMIDSIEATHAYASQRRTKLINMNAGLNVATFARYGNDPDKVFPVAGRPDDLIKYVDLPPLYQGIQKLRERMELSIFLITGIDLRYTGRDTGSISTTGGMDMLQARVSMSDNVRIIMLEKFAKDLTQMILDFYMEFGDKRNVPIKNKQGDVTEQVEINFEELRKEKIKFDFTVHASPYLPKNLARLSEAANMIMEKQMQYQMDPPLMTPEEWLSAQDFPQKHHMLDRMEAERQQDDLEDVMSTLGNFAGLVGQQVRPEEAVSMLAEEKSMKRQNPKMGNTGNSGSFQNKQMG